jgi:hypothetical protein
MSSGVFRGGGGRRCDRPPFGVIRGAMIGVWLGFLPGSTEEKKVVKMFWDGNLRRLVCVLKKGRQIFWPPPFQISKYATVYVQVLLYVS